MVKNIVKLDENTIKSLIREALDELDLRAMSQRAMQQGIDNSNWNRGLSQSSLSFQRNGQQYRPTGNPQQQQSTANSQQQRMPININYLNNILQNLTKIESDLKGLINSLS